MKKLMLEDLSADTYHKNQTLDTTPEHRTMDYEPVNQFAKRKKGQSKTCQQANRIPLEHPKDAVCLVHIPQTSESFGEPRTMGMCHQFRQEDRSLKGNVRKTATYGLCAEVNEINLQQNWRTAKVHNDQLVIGRNSFSKDGVNLEPRQFSDALESLKMKRLYLESLQFEEPDIKFSEHGSRGASNSPNSEFSVRTRKQFEDSVYCKKVEDQYIYSSSRSSSPRPSNEIVVLRPSPKIMETPEHVTCCSSLRYHQRFEDKGSNKPAYLSLKEIKKRWKRAMGENRGKRYWISSIVSFHKIPTRKQILAEAGRGPLPGSCTSKPASSSAHTIKREESHRERDIQSRSKPEIPTTENTVHRILKPATGCSANHSESDIFEEAKKHLLERVKNVKRNEVTENRKTRRPLARILSSPEQDLCSAVSPKWNTKYGFVSTERTFSGGSLSKGDRTFDCSVCPLVPIPDFNSPVHTSASEDDSTVLKRNDIGLQDGIYKFEVLSESISMDFTCARHSPDRSSERDGAKSASPSNDQITRSSFGASPSSPTSQLPVFDNFIDGEEHQSPVSVLEPLTMEDADSPKSITIQSSEGPSSPCRTDSKECARTLEGLSFSAKDLEVSNIDCTNDDKAISTYMRTVLRAAGLNWDDPLLTSPSPEKVLDTSFSYGKKLFGTKSYLEPELLFHCVNDVLLKVYEHHFGCSPWTSYLKPNTTAFPREDCLVGEVVNDVKRLLLLQFVQPTLDQLVGHDIGRSALRLDIRRDTEEFVTQIAEDLLEELVEDTILMFYI